MEEGEGKRRPEPGFRLWGAVMVGICFVTGLVAYGGGRYSFGVFMKPMTEAMGWTRTQMSLGATINLICYGLASPLVGRMFDSLGIKHTMVVGAALLSLAFGSMYFCTGLWMFYFLYGVLAALGLNMMGRIAQATIVVHWFVRQRGLMLGVTAVSIGLGTTVMAPASNVVLHAFGWQWAFVFLGALFLVFVLAPVAFFIKGKGRPEDRGFQPDGAPPKKQDPPQVDGKVPAPAGGDDWTAAMALRTTALWGIFIAMSLSYMADYIVLFHAVACLGDRGLTSGVATSVLAAATFVSCLGRLGFGWLADRIDIRTCMALMFAFQIVAMPFLLAGDTRLAYLYTFAAIWGIGYGALATLMPAIAGQYFGRRHFGSIYGWVTMATVFGGAVGSTLGGWIHDVRGSYDLAWYACLVMWAVACVAVYAMAKKPQKTLVAVGGCPPGDRVTP